MELSRPGIELLGKRLHPVPTGLMPVSDRMNQVLPRLHLVIGRLQSIPIGMELGILRTKLRSDRIDLGRARLST